MSIAWLTVLKSVPWVDVISNAPKVAEGAKKLWGKVGKTPEPVPSSPEAEAAPPSLSSLHERVLAMETAVGELHEQMLASSELIKTLAEQNAQLVARVESHRVRVMWLTLWAVLAGGIAVTALTLLLIR